MPTKVQAPPPPPQTGAHYHHSHLMAPPTADGSGASTPASTHSGHHQRHHSDALKLALGGILAPRRPSPARTPSGYGHSGSLMSKAHSSSSGSPPHSTHAASTTAIPELDLSSPASSAHDLPAARNSSDLEDVDMPMPPSNVTLTSNKARRPSIQRRHSVDNISPETDVNGKPLPPSAAAQRSRFVETLGSKKAWDALIHGAFS